MHSGLQKCEGAGFAMESDKGSETAGKFKKSGSFKNKF